MRQLAADRKRKMDYFEGIANQYDQEYGSVDMSSVERQVGKEAQTSPVKGPKGS